MSNIIAKMKKNGNKVVAGVNILKEQAEFKKNVADATNHALAEQLAKRGIAPTDIKKGDFVMHENKNRIDYAFKGEIILQALMKEVNDKPQIAFFVPKMKEKSA